MHVHRLLALAALLPSPFALPASAEEPTEYAGFGFVDPLPLATGRATAVELVDVGGRATPDLAVLTDGGTLYLNVDGLEYGTSASTTGIVAMTATHDGTGRLWVTDGARILEVGYDDENGSITLTGPTTTFFTGDVTRFRAQESPAGPRLVAVDAYGARALVFELVPAGWTLARTVQATVDQGTFHDGALVDWTGLGLQDLALATDQGLQVLDPWGATIGVKPGAPWDSWVELLPGARAAWGRDLVLWHHRPPGGGDALLFVGNADHAESLAVEGLGLDDLRVGDFLFSGDGLDEVVLSRGDDRSAWILDQTPGATPAAPIFDLVPPADGYIDLYGAGQAPPDPAPLAAADLDGDGDEDLVFVNDRYEALYVLSNSEPEETLRVGLASGSSPQILNRQYSFTLTVTLPPGADSYEHELYYQPDPSAPVQLLVGGTRSDPLLPLSATLPSVPGPTEVIQFLVRGVKAGTGERLPARVEYWSPDSITFSNFQNSSGQRYPWYGNINGDPGGTTRFPKINPGP